MTDVPFKVIPMSEVVPSEETKKVINVIDAVAPTATRSDHLSAVLLQHGLGPEFVAAQLKELSEASSTTWKPEWDEEKKAWVRNEVTTPDYKAKEFVLRYLKEVHGWEFKEKGVKEGNVPAVYLQVVNDFRTNSKVMSPRDLGARVGIVIDDMGNVVKEGDGGSDISDPASDS